MQTPRPKLCYLDLNHDVLLLLFNGALDDRRSITSLMQTCRVMHSIGIARFLGLPIQLDDGSLHGVYTAAFPCKIDNLRLVVFDEELDEASQLARIRHCTAVRVGFSSRSPNPRRE